MEKVLMPLYFFGFLFLRFVNNLIRSCWWKFTGVEREFIASLDSPVNEKKIQVLRILLKQTDAGSLSPASIHKYLCWHEDFYPMDYLLKPNVSLCVVNNFSETYFLETDPSADVFNIRSNPFFFMSQHQHAVKLIRVHSADLIDYCKKLKHPGVKVTWILHSTRCGSTALCQALWAIPNWKVLSECGWLATMFPRNLKTFEEFTAFLKGPLFYELARACLKMQLLHFPDSANLCWKTTGTLESWVLPVLSKEYPEHKIIYMLRNGLPTANSMSKMASTSAVFKIFVQLFNLNPIMISRVEMIRHYQHMFCNGCVSELTQKYWFDGKLTLFELFYCTWLTNMHSLQINGNDIPMMIIEYDYYMKDLSANLKKVLDYIGITSPDHLALALDTYKLDSQENSPISQKRLKGGVSWVRHEPTVRKATELAKSFGLPEFDEPLTQRTFGSEKWTYIMEES